MWSCLCACVCTCSCICASLCESPCSLVCGGQKSALDAFLCVSVPDFFEMGLSLSVGQTCLSLLVDQQTPGSLPALSFQCFYYVCILQHLALKLGAEELGSSSPMLGQQASRPLSLLSCLPVAFGTWFLSSRLPAQVKLATSAFLLVFHVLKDTERVN